MGNKKSFPAHFPYPTAPVGNKVKAPDAQSSRSSNPRADKKVARNSKQKKPESRLETSLQDPKLPQILAAIQIEDMPEEILFHLLGFLFDTNDALLPSPIAAMLVCSKWRRLINELQMSPVALPWRRRRDEIAFRRRPDYVKKKVFITAKKSHYEGEWVGEFGKHGKGKVRYSDGDVYEGEWLRDMRHGKGTYIWASGHTYVGDWVDGERHGDGTYTSPNGDYYRGEWRHNMRSGKGIWIDSRGTRYEGDYVEGKAEGFGVMFSPVGSGYKGQWKGGNGHGWGVYAYTNGERYEGQWAHGKRSGWGVYTYTNGDTYYGYWSTGAQNGRGTHYFHDGGKFEGEWQQGLPVESAVGILTMTDGKKHECLWNEIPTLLPATARYLPSITPVTLPSKPSTSQRILGALYPRNALKASNANVARNNTGIWSRPMYLPHAMLLH